MTIKEFTKKYEINESGVYKKIKRNAKRLDGHIEMQNGIMNLDDVAVDILKPQNYELKIENERLSNNLETLEQEKGEKLDEYMRKLSECYEDYGKLDKELYETRRFLELLIIEKQALEDKYNEALEKIQHLEAKVAFLENGKKRGIFGSGKR